MPRRSTRFVPGGYYHIYNRGANKVSLFHKEQNYLFVLRWLKHYACRLQISVIAYCLMPNHYHWLVRQDGEAAAGLLPQRVFNVYSHAVHTYEGHSGTLFEGRYKAIQVERDEYLRHLCRYIHTNPVRHGFAGDPAEWPYSNYLEWVGERGGTLVDRVFIAERFFTPEQYKAYLYSYLAGQALAPRALDGYLLHLEDVT